MRDFLVGEAGEDAHLRDRGRALVTLGEEIKGIAEMNRVERLILPRRPDRPKR